MKEPKTIRDFERIQRSIVELMRNPWMDLTCQHDLSLRLKDVKMRIEKLRNNQNV